MAIGIVSCNVENEAEPAMALLSESLAPEIDHNIRMSAIIGYCFQVIKFRLGIAYIGTRKEPLLHVLLPLLDVSEDTPLNLEIIGMGSLALGLIFGGSGNPEITSTIIQSLMSLQESDLEHPFVQLMLLGLSFLFLSRSSEYDVDDKSSVDGDDMIDVVLESIRVISHVPTVKQAETLIMMMSHAGSGNVLKIQEAVASLCLQNKNQQEQEGKGESSTYSSGRPYAVIALAAIAMGEEIGTEMAFRLLGHLVFLLSILILDALWRSFHSSCRSTGHGVIISLGSKDNHSRNTF